MWTDNRRRMQREERATDERGTGMARALREEAWTCDEATAGTRCDGAGRWLEDDAPNALSPSTAAGMETVLCCLLCAAALPFLRREEGRRGVDGRRWIRGNGMTCAGGLASLG